MNAWLEVIFVLVSLVLTSLAIRNAWEPIQDPCSMMDAQQTCRIGGELLSDFDKQCPEADDLNGCDSFKRLSAECGQCLLESLALEDLGACFKDFWHDRVNAPCMRSVVFNLFHRLFQSFYHSFFQDIELLAICGSSHITNTLKVEITFLYLYTLTIQCSKTRNFEEKQFGGVWT
jgi:hypothetical protein